MSFPRDGVKKQIACHKSSPERPAHWRRRRQEHGLSPRVCYAVDHRRLTRARPQESSSAAEFGSTSSVANNACQSGTSAKSASIGGGIGCRASQRQDHAAPLGGRPRSASWLFRAPEASAAVRPICGHNSRKHYPWVEIVCDRAA